MSALDILYRRLVDSGVAGPELLAQIQADLDAAEATLDATKFKIGDILTTRRTPDPGKWRYMNGAAYLISAYPELFGLLRTPVFPAMSFSDGTAIPITVGRITKVVKGAGLYVAAIKPDSPSAQHVQTSTDLVNWTPRNVRSPAGGSSNLGTDLAFGNGVFVAMTAVASQGGDPGLLYSSTDGITWTRRVTVGGSAVTTFYDTEPGVGGVVFGNGRFVATVHTLQSNSNTGVYWHSTNGTAWTQATINNFNGGVAGGYIQGVAFAGGYHIVFTAAGVHYSTDGLTWGYKTFAQIGASSLVGAFFAQGRIHLIPGGRSTSSSGAFFTVATTDFETFTQGFRLNAGKLMEWIDIGTRTLVIAQTTSPSVTAQYYLYDGPDNVAFSAFRSDTISTAASGYLGNSEGLKGEGKLLYYESNTPRPRTLNIPETTEFTIQNTPTAQAVTGGSIGFNYIRAID